jgi:hypothetical protein
MCTERKGLGFRASLLWGQNWITTGVKIPLQNTSSLKIKIIMVVEKST